MILKSVMLYQMYSDYFIDKQQNKTRYLSIIIELQENKKKGFKNLNANLNNF